MTVVHPMLRNILSLADPGTWQKSIDLADEAFEPLSRPRIRAWAQTAGGGGLSLQLESQLPLVFG